MYTDKEQEAYLNDLFFETLGFEDALDKFEYMESKQRVPKAVKRSTIERHIHNQTLGTLLRKYDPVAFQVSKQDRSRP